MAQYQPSIDVSSLDGDNGFRIDGFASNDMVGYALASAGDVNGDGYADLIVGASGTALSGVGSGSSFVIFGGPHSGGASVNLATLDGTDGFRMDGVGAFDYSGHSVASAGDVNGDGFADLIIGATDATGDQHYSGAAYVVFGQASGFSAAVNLASLDGNNGFVLKGVDVSDYAGQSVASAGDINGDGFDDLVVGAFHADPNGNKSGASYVVFGHAGGFAPGGVDLGALSGADGFRMDGLTAYDQNGFAVASAGDVNGDGIDDLMVSSDEASPNGTYSGSTYVVFGKTTPFAATLDLSSLDGTNGFRLDGEHLADHAGQSIASAGDINGDGYADMIVGAHFADPNGSTSGSAYVVFGHAGGFSATVDLGGLTGADGFRIDGQSLSDSLGYSVASAGDVNGDGFDDLLVGAHFAPNGGGDGVTYVIFGHAGGFAANFDLSTLDGTNGFAITDTGNDEAFGSAVASAGDINGDGIDDLILGAPHAAPGGDAYAGSVYVIYGALPDAAVTRVGSIASQQIVGGDFGDRLEGRGGDDVLIGHGGADLLFGNIGNDSLEGGDGDDRMQGAAGDDLLNGGGGRDVMTGGAGDDVFVFAAGDSVDGARDRIRDFTSGEDKIDLHLIDADTTAGGDQAFHLGAGPRFTGEAGELVVRHVGSDTVVLGDVDGDGDSDFTIVLNGAHVLTGADFVL